MKYIRNLHHIDDRVLSVSPQTGKDTRVFVGIVIVCGTHKYCIPLSPPKDKHKRMRNSMDFSKIEVDGKLLGVLNFNLMIPIEEAQLQPIDLIVYLTIRFLPVTVALISTKWKQNARNLTRKPRKRL